MRRNPLIIHLYDKPHSRRAYVRHSAPSSGAGTAVLACAAIAGCVAVFFWVYDAVAHRDPSFVPALAHSVAAGARSTSAAPILVPPEAPAPDLHSPAVALANADVPPAPLAVAAKARDQATPEKQKKAETPPKKKRVHVAKRLPPEAAQSYASAPGFFRIPFGGF